MPVKRVFLVSAAVFLASLNLLPSSRAHEIDKSVASQSSIADDKCMDNLRLIYRLLRIRLDHSGGVVDFPSNIDQLWGMSEEPTNFICPADKQIDTPKKTKAFQTSYEIVNNPLRHELSIVPPDKIAIVAEKRANHNGRRFVLFYDGSVRAFDNAQFEALKKEAFIDD